MTMGTHADVFRIASKTCTGRAPEETLTVALGTRNVGYRAG
jgi:hypothetical protein